MLPGLFDDVMGVRLFGYISFRIVMAALTGFVLALGLGGPVIAWLKSHRVGERADKTDAPALAEEAKRTGKQDTPTMGGSFLVGSLLVAVLLWARLDNLYVVLGVVLTMGLAAVGFVDDFKKLTIEGSKGLSARAKMRGLTVVAGGVLCGLGWYAWSSGRGEVVALFPPFFKDRELALLDWGLLGVALYVAFAWFVVVGSANASNIVDGLDGLAAGSMIISGGALTIFCYVMGRWDWTGYLGLPHVRPASEMAVVGGALMGACMGFLWHNAYPARVFMGDSGSLPLGGLLAWMALVSKQELVLPLIALVFVLDLSSSALQTFYFRRTGGKRLFTCAPVHHGLQLYGGVFKPGPAKWHEVTVVVRFWILGACGALASLALLKVR